MTGYVTPKFTASLIGSYVACHRIYSSRRAIMGSRREARRAGSTLPSAAASARAIAAAPSRHGSRAEIPNSSDAVASAAATDAASPIARPPATSRAASRTTSPQFGSASRLRPPESRSRYAAGPPGTPALRISPQRRAAQPAPRRSRTTQPGAAPASGYRKSAAGMTGIPLVCRDATGRSAGALPLPPPPVTRRTECT